MRPHPSWFTTVMGTGIVANAAVTLPVHGAALVDAARVVWLLAATLLVVVAVRTAPHLLGHLDDPRSAPFLGAAAMALLTVGSGVLLLGLPGPALGATLWLAGTAAGLLTAVAVPYRAFTGTPAAPDAATGAWLVPVVPPMVSAATGPLLLPHLPAGQWRLTLLVACAAMFGAALLAGLLVVGTVWSRLVHHGVGPEAGVPALWIVLGVLGQSVTAAHALAVAAGEPRLWLAYGLPVWGFAVLWLALVVALTVRAARRGLRFDLSWWAFTFPLGTVVTGTSALAASTGAVLLQVAAVGLYAGLVGLWATVAVRTAGLVLSSARTAPRTSRGSAVAR